MALKIRLQRVGKKHAPVYRMVVAESAARRDGRYVEALGHYNPSASGQDPEYKLNIERLEYWLGVGAQPTNTARMLIKRARKQKDNVTEKGEVIAYAAA